MEVRAADSSCYFQRQGRDGEAVEEQCFVSYRKAKVRCMLDVGVCGMLSFSLAEAMGGFVAEAALGNDLGRVGCGMATMGV